MKVINKMLEISFIWKAFIFLLFYFVYSAVEASRIGEILFIKISHRPVQLRELIGVYGFKCNLNDVQVREKNMAKITIKHIDVHDVFEGGSFKEMVMVT